MKLIKKTKILTMAAFGAALMIYWLSTGELEFMLGSILLGGIALSCISYCRNRCNKNSLLKS